ncbi:glutaminyl-peptide cyclotransferase [Olivibacter sp. XZL3]|uniref:glutaminyl-peptide cyclotransferase n=1 Tax=Olivibacter sp. XZL3 TaxID=1735116 RepID=UPI001066F477|nr:glutaminyl-peptide cyclotransferase [Olivibacter sp. XZL3]
MNYLSLLLFTSTLSFALLTSCNTENQSQSDPTEPNAANTSVQTPALISYSIIDTFTHDVSAFTEGFLFYKGQLYEGTGQEGRTAIQIVDPTSGKIVERFNDYKTTIFGEGITILNEYLYQLTYQNKSAYIFSLANLRRPVKTLEWPKEGWGCTTDGKHIIISDGSSKLYFADPENLNIKHEITVKDNKGELDQLNELEYIDGYIYANRWHTDQIYKIDPNNGHVLAVLHFEGQLSRYAPTFQPGAEHVLNGIAWDAEKNEMYLTGKNWPLVFKIKME